MSWIWSPLKFLYNFKNLKTKSLTYLKKEKKYFEHQLKGLVKTEALARVKHWNM